VPALLQWQRRNRWRPASPRLPSAWKFSRRRKASRSRRMEARAGFMGSPGRPASANSTLITYVREPGSSSRIQGVFECSVVAPVQLGIGKVAVVSPSCLRSAAAGEPGRTTANSAPGRCCRRRLTIEISAPRFFRRPHRALTFSVCHGCGSTACGEGRAGEGFVHVSVGALPERGVRVRPGRDLGGSGRRVVREEAVHEGDRDCADISSSAP